jgi:prepilin peptidase CpaA
MESLVRLLFIAIIVAAAIWDIRQRRIPNVLTAGAMVIALTTHCWTSGLDGLTRWFLGLAAGVGLLLLPYLMGGMGAGDVKLMGCAGSMLGPFQVLCAFLVAAVIGGLMAVGALSTRAGGACEDGPSRRHIPYGLPLAAGVLLSAAGAWLRW